MKVSIITPSFNQAEFLEHTILSVICQDYNDIEYILIDGKSSDNSIDIIKKYSDRIAWWVSEPDNGQAAAINKGLHKASGEIVAWLNSDDMYAPGAISTAVNYFKDNPSVGLVYGDGISFDQDGYPLNDLKSGEWDLKDLVSFHIICQPTVFFRKKLLEEIGYLDEDYHLLLDHQLWLRIARITEIRHVSGIQAFARHHPEAKNVASAAGFVGDANKVLDWMQSQPDIEKIIHHNRRAVMAMFHRFNGRYLLDSGQSRAAIRSYWYSFKWLPTIALKEWHRILFAILSIIGFKSIGNVYYSLKRKVLPDAVRARSIKNIHQLYSGEGI